jgi:hypothetical protein
MLVCPTGFPKTCLATVNRPLFALKRPAVDRLATRFTGAIGKPWHWISPTKACKTNPTTTEQLCQSGRRDRNRTCNLRFWRPLLCLIELPAYRRSSYHTGYEDASCFPAIAAHAAGNRTPASADFSYLSTALCLSFPGLTAARAASGFGLRQRCLFSPQIENKHHEHKALLLGIRRNRRLLLFHCAE